MGDMLVRAFFALLQLLATLVVSAVRFVVTLLGPGLSAAVVAVVLALWWFKWI